MNLTLLNASNRNIGVASPSPGITHSGDCVFKSDFGKVPVTSDFYAVDSSRRGKSTYSKAGLQARNYRLELSVGYAG